MTIYNLDSVTHSLSRLFLLESGYEGTFSHLRVRTAPLTNQRLQLYDTTGWPRIITSNTVQHPLSYSVL